MDRKYVQATSWTNTCEKREGRHPIAQMMLQQGRSSERWRTRNQGRGAKGRTRRVGFRMQDCRGALIGRTEDHDSRR